MPEGDTIFVAARTLGRALVGRLVSGYRATIVAAQGDLVGRTIVKVEPRGKNLLMHFDDGRVLHSHMQMKGSWHVYRPGERWQRPEYQARIVIETEQYVAVCFNAEVVSLLSERGVQRTLLTLGPDILAEPWEREAILARLRARGDLAIGVALLDQRLVAGIGNVYKSEVLFGCKVDPWTLVDRLSDQGLGHIVDTAREMMRANLEGKRRQTRPAEAQSHGGLLVYDRSGKPCWECGGAIDMRRQGDQGRSTYFCPVCQVSTVCRIGEK